MRKQSGTQASKQRGSEVAANPVASSPALPWAGKCEFRKWHTGREGASDGSPRYRSAKDRSVRDRLKQVVIGPY